MDNFYQRLGVRALNDSTPESSAKKKSNPYKYMAFVANQSPDGNYHKEDSFCSAARFYSEEELFGIDEEDVAFDLFGFSHNSNGEKVYVTTITELDEQATDALLFYKKEADEVIKKIKAAIAADDTNGHGRDVYSVQLMETAEGTGYWLYIVRVN